MEYSRDIKNVIINDIYQHEKMFAIYFIVKNTDKKVVFFIGFLI